jgi:hypothetical protein
MKLIGALAAASMVMMSAPAMAGSVTLSIGGHCNILSVRVQSSTLVAARENDACTQIIGEGFVGTIQHQKRATIAYTDPSLPGDQLTLLLQYPFVSGGTWALFVTTDGRTMSQIDEGTYTVGGTAASLTSPDGRSMPPLGFGK